MKEGGSLWNLREEHSSRREHRRRQPVRPGSGSSTTLPQASRKNEKVWADRIALEKALGKASGQAAVLRRLENHLPESIPDQLQTRPPPQPAAR